MEVSLTEQCESEANVLSVQNKQNNQNFHFKHNFSVLILKCIMQLWILCHLCSNIISPTAKEGENVRKCSDVQFLRRN